ncbi:MAG TPA: molybdopterin-dependent oxidoreductase, partial [Acidimicrobiales bacterium]
VLTTQMWHRAIKSPSFHTSITIDQPAKSTAPARIGWWEAGFNSFRSSDVSLAVGYNPLVSGFAPQGGLQGTNPFVELRRAKARGLKLIVVDPRRTELASFADLFLQVVPGEDASLLAGLLNVILSEGLHDLEFCDGHVDQLAELMAAVAPFTPDYVAERCGITEEEVVRAARMFAAGPRGIAGTGTGPGMAPRCSLTEHLVIALNVVCGRVNREGDRVNNPGVLVGDRPFRAQVMAARPEALTRGEPSRFRNLHGFRGQMPTNALADEILERGEGQVKALVVIGGNPAVAWPDQAKTMAAMRELDLLVVLDHRMTPTAKEAHYVLGSKLALERADVTHIMDPWFEEPYVNHTPAVVEADPEVLNEWELIWELSRRMSVTVELPGGPLPTDRKPTDDEVIELVYPTSRVPLADVRAAGGGRIHPDLEVVVEPAEPGATARFTVAPPDIVAELAEVRVERSSAEILPGYEPEHHTYRLTSRRLKTVLNSLGPELPGLKAKGSTNFAYMHPDDLTDLGAADGDLLEIASPRGRILGVAAASPDLRRGVVSMAHSWGDGRMHDEAVRDIGSPTNRLVDNASGWDVVTGQAVQSAIPVSVRRADEPLAVAGE